MKKVVTNKIYKPLLKTDLEIRSKKQTGPLMFLKKGDIKHAPEKLSITAKEIENLLDAINKTEKFVGEWKAPGQWK